MTVQSPSPLLTSLPAPRASHRIFGATRGLLAGAVLLAVLPACTTSRSTRAKFLERVPPPQPLLGATATYGEGALAVQAWLGSSVRLRKSAEHMSPEERRILAGGRPQRTDRDEVPLGAFNAPFDPGAGDSDRYSKEEIDEMYGRVNYQYVLPPRLALTFTLVNKSAKPMMVTLTEVSSPLGNFAPRPETLMLKPGQEGTVDPMLSNLDNNFDELEVTLGVKLGERPEQQILHLRRTQEPPPPAPGP